jgi:hypothetical protein
MPKVLRSKRVVEYNYNCACGYSIKCNTEGQRIRMRNLHKIKSCPLNTILIEHEPMVRLQGVQLPQHVIEEKRQETINRFLELQ